MNSKNEIKFLKQENECLKKQIELLKLLDLQLRCKDTPTVIPWPIINPSTWRRELFCDTL
jgi:hypothetical protein